MRKFIHNKKHMIVTLLLILTISNFSISFAYWASNIIGDQANSNLSISLGEWDFEDIDLEVATFRGTHAIVLTLTEATVEITDKAAVEAALADYGLLSDAAKAELLPEQALLLSLFNEIIALENSEFLDFESSPYDSGLTGTIDFNGRTWYADDVFISNDSNHDVWNDTRSLALRSTASFESQEFFINGIDKITLYHGALHFDNGVNFQFKVEYELAINPGVWEVLQDGGSDMLIDVLTGTPLTYTEIDVNITEALNIRFVPIIGSTTDYINLDDIRIYEHVVSSALEATTFRTIYADTLTLTVASVEVSDKTAVEQALAAYDLLSVDAKTELTPEKALLDSLLVEIELIEDIVEAEAFVVIAENSISQTDVDAAQVLVSALPNSTIKTDLQDRLDVVQDLIDDIATFQNDHAVALTLTVGTVLTSDQAIVEAAITAYELLSDGAKAELTTEKALLDSLLVEINNQIPTATQVAQFQSDHAVVLALTVGTVTTSDKTGVEFALAQYELLSVDAKTVLTPEKALLDSLLIEIELQEAQALIDIEVATFRSDNAVVLALTVQTVTIIDKTAVETALAEYGLLSVDAKTELVVEQNLLLDLYNEIIGLEHSEFLDFESDPYDSGLTGTVDMNGRTWYGNDIYISNDANYDVWNDTRSLALRSTSYFQSQDLFINGIDKITIYHGALNFNNGTSFQFKVEYELATNPGVWVTLQDGSSDLLIDVISATPLTFTEIDVNIGEALNIRFTPVISTTTDYINLDDIRIYEHIVSSAIEVTTFTTIYASELALNIATVEITDKSAIEQTLIAYELLSVDAKAALTAEKALLDSLLVEINSQIPLATQVAEFQSDHAVALALTVGTVTPPDRTAVQTALAMYDLLSIDAKTALTTEKALLDSLLEEINFQEAEALVVIAEASNLQTDVDNALVIVSTLPNGNVKTDLEDRLDAVKDIIDVETASQLITSYFSSNSVTVSKLNNATAIKETAFISKVNENVTGLDVIVSITNTDEVDRRNTTYTITITKNGASVTIDVDVSFRR